MPITVGMLIIILMVLETYSGDVMNDDHVLGCGAGIIACQVVIVAICVVLLSMGYTEIDFILK